MSSAKTERVIGLVNAITSKREELGQLESELEVLLAVSRVRRKTREVIQPEVGRRGRPARGKLRVLKFFQRHKGQLVNANAVMKSLGISDSVFYLYAKKLMEEKLISKVSRGNYQLA